MRQKNRLLYNHEIEALSHINDPGFKMVRKPIIIALKKPSAVDQYECVTALTQCYVDISTTWNELMGKCNPDIEFIAIHLVSYKFNKILICSYNPVISIV